MRKRVSEARKGGRYELRATRRIFSDPDDRSFREPPPAHEEHH